MADFGVSSLITDNDILNNTEGTYFFMARNKLNNIFLYNINTINILFMT